MRRSRLSLVTALVAGTSAALLAVPAVAGAAPEPKPGVPVQLIAMNDFHGRIANTTGSDSQQITAPGPDGAFGTKDDVVETVGGAANVATTVKRLQSSFAAATGTEKSGSWFVGAGDLISASPFESGTFKDEPTIEVLDAMGLDASSVGNHEFDRGTRELRRISAATDGTFSDDVTACQGITPGVDGCFGEGEHAFDGADFPYLAANVVSRSTGQPMLPPYQVFDIPGGRKIALIGVVTRATPTIVSPDGVSDVTFIDEADAVNAYVPELTRRGVEAVGVLVHEGGQQSGPAKADPNGCNGLSGPIVDLNNRISDEVDLIVSAHTHQAYNCRLVVPGGPPRLVTSAGFYGRELSDIRLTLDARTGEVDRSATYAATNVPVTRTDPDAHVQSIVDYWFARSAAAGNTVIGSITGDITRAYSGVDANGKPIENRGGESSLGNLIAQAQLDAMQQDQYGRPVIAFMNPGGLRTDLTYSAGAGGEQPGEITYRELYNVQPFGNTVNAATLTGADIDDLLEQQFQADPDGAGPLPPAGPRASQLILGTNAGFSYDYDLTRPYGDRVPDSSIRLGGTVIDPGTTYRVAMNSFLATGGDGFTVFRNGTNPVTGPVDVDTAVAYFRAHPSVSPPPANHSTALAG